MPLYKSTGQPHVQVWLSHSRKDTVNWEKIENEAMKAIRGLDQLQMRKMCLDFSLKPLKAELRGRVMLIA